MKTIFDELFKELLPQLAREKYSDVAEVIDCMIQNFIIDNIKVIVHSDRVDEMSELELDLLSKELHIDYYDPSFSIEEKRKMCKLSFLTHFYKGTSYAVSEAANIFYKDSTVLEWYKTDSTPGTFSLKLNGLIKDNLNKTVYFIENAKKKSQKLDKIIFSTKISTTYFSKFLVRQYTKQTLFPAQLDIYISPVKSNSILGKREIKYMTIGGTNGSL